MKSITALIDTNVVLDWILKRRPFHESSTEIIDFCMRKKIHGYLAAHTILNVFYITRKDFSVAEGRSLSGLLCSRFEIIGIDRRLLIEALDASDFRDLEDSLQMECAIEKGLNYIITRDINDFKNSRIKAMPPEDFLSLWHTDTYET